MDINSFGILGIYAAAFVLGGLHSLEPGHGKTVVAAYLIGSKGRSRDAVILGLVVAVTHSLGIIILGVMAKLSSQYLTDRQLHAYLGIAASLIILGIGLWMLKTRWQALKGRASHTHRHLSHSHVHGSHRHHHPHDGPEDGHGDVFEMHTSDSRFGHHHMHAPADDKPLGLTGLILLGISGGMIPCPAALAILLASVSVGDIGKGLALVIIFSIGLAFCLVAIGLIIVNGVKFTQRFMDMEKHAPKIAFLSAVVVTLVGVFTLYSSLSHFGVV